MISINTKSPGTYALNSSNNNWYQVTSYVVGFEQASANELRYRIVRYEFKTPEKLNEDNIAGFSELTINLPVSNSANYYYIASSDTSKQNIYYLISSKSQITVEDISANVGTNQIVNFTTVNLIDTPSQITLDASSLKPNTTYYLYMHSDQFETAWYRGWYNKEAELEIEPYAYTACGAPTSVTANKAYVTPKGSVIISWKGAKAGTENTIAGYKIYYQLGGKNLSKKIDSKSTSGSVTITLDGTGSRGEKVDFTVETIGSAGGNFNSGASTAKATVKINNLPTITSVTLDRSKIPSKGGNVVVTKLAGEDDDGQALTYAYSLSKSGDKFAIKQNSSIEISKGQEASQTIWFWAYDGYEYSSAAQTQTVTFNTVPVLTYIVQAKEIFVGGNTTSNGKIYANGIEATVTSEDGRAIKLSANVILNGNTVTYSSSTNQLSFSNIENKSEFAGNITGDLEYVVELTASDEYESFSTKSYYYLLPGPQQINAELDGGTVFYKVITLTQNQDTSITSYEIGGNLKGAGLKTTKKNNKVTHTITVPANQVSGDEVNVSIISKVGNITKTSNVLTLTAGQIPKVNNMSWGRTTPFYAFDQAETTSLFKIFFSDYMPEEEVEAVSIKLWANNVNVAKIIYPTYSFAVNEMSLDISKAKVFGLSDFEYNTYGLKDTNGWLAKTYSLNHEVTITNKKGVSFSFTQNSPLIKLSFEAEPKEVSFVIKYNEIEEFKIQEDMILSFTLTLKPFAKADYYADIFYSFDNQNWNVIKSNFKIEQQTGTEAYSADGTTPGEITNPIQITAPPITNSTIYWKTEIKNTKVSSTLVASGLRHEPIKDFQITGGDVTEENDFQVNFEYSDLGIDSGDGISYKTELYIGEEETPATSLNSITNKALVFEHGVSNPPYRAKLVTTTAITQSINGEDYSHEVTSETSWFVIYFEAPTVSYRQNCLGINTKDPQTKEEAILVLSPTSARTQIYLNISSEKNAIIEMTKNGAEITGFVVDCGEWQ